MLAVKKPLLLASAVMSAALLVGCSSQAVPEAAPSEAAPTTSAPTEEATTGAAPEQEVEEVEPLAVEPTPEEAEEAPEESSVSPEERVVPLIEEAMGEGACWGREVHNAGAPLAEWSYDEYFIDEYDEHGPLNGSLTRVWCEKTDEADPLAPWHITLRFFADPDDLASDQYQLGIARMDMDELHIYSHPSEVWTATTYAEGEESWRFSWELMEDLGALNHSFDDQ